MLVQRLHRSFSSRRIGGFLLAGIAASTLPLSGARIARAADFNFQQARFGLMACAISTVTEYEPIGITVNDDLKPGQPLACTVELTGGPANVTITSDPPGLVSYSGTVSSATATVQASTSLSASGRITLYAMTDGEVVVSTHVKVRPSLPYDPSLPSLVSKAH